MHEADGILKVLIADDERIIANTLTLILNTSGYEAKAVYSGEKALELASEMSPDVLICDVILGGISGIDVAIHIARDQPACRVILFSGQAATADLLERAEADGYRFDILAKPIHPKVLLDYLARLKSTSQPYWPEA
ncbi:MAG: response regulator [Terracidiphilus sp.]